MSTLEMTPRWDKTFPRDHRIHHEKIEFPTRFGTTLAADLYRPIKAEGSLPGIAVSGPFGAVKEQSSGLYAQTLGAAGFLTIAFDPSFTGESSGTPRYVASPDINTEDFSAAVDFLSMNSLVDQERIGILGICGWGGIALNAAALDPRIKATVASTMYDMTRVNAYGYNDALTPSDRNELRAKLAVQRLKDLTTGQIARAGGVVDPLPQDAPQFVKDYYSYYKTDRGYHPRSLNSTEGWNITSALSFLNAKFMQFTDEIDRPVLIIHGEDAHSRYFSETAFANLKGDDKELLIIPGARHTDLYDQPDIIPFDAINDFFTRNLCR